jgi:hypothetical protein
MQNEIFMVAKEKLLTYCMNVFYEGDSYRACSNFPFHTNGLESVAQNLKLNRNFRLSGQLQT